MQRYDCSLVGQLIDDILLNVTKNAIEDPLQYLADKLARAAIYLVEDNYLHLYLQSIDSEEFPVHTDYNVNQKEVQVKEDSAHIPMVINGSIVGLCIWRTNSCNHQDLVRLQGLLSLAAGNLPLEKKEKQKDQEHILQILSQCEKAITDMDYSFLSSILHEVLHLVPEADYGSVSIIEDDKWEFVDAVGHDIKILKEIPLKYEYESVHSMDSAEVESGIYVIRNILNNKSGELVIPEPVKDLILQASKPIKETLIVKIRFGNRLLGQISLDIAEGSDRSFSTESFNKLMPYKHLTSIFLMFSELYSAQNKLDHVMNLSSQILMNAENGVNFNEFLSKLLKIALHEIAEADYGSISIVEDNVWTFVDAVGHDIEKLKELRLTADTMINRLKNRGEIREIYKNVFMIPNILDTHDGSIPSSLRFASLPIKESLQVPIYYNKQIRGMLSLDIDAASSKTFSHKYVHLLKLIGDIGSIFIAYKHSFDMIGKFEKLTGLASKLVSASTSNDMGFLKELLQVALSQITEADYGSISLVEGEEWRFVDAVGHDADILQSLPLKKEYLIDIHQINIHDLPFANLA